jgi:phenylacetate-coenzyme A ligase PaaK-like adenylate-forming protein
MEARKDEFNSGNQRYRLSSRQRAGLHSGSELRELQLKRLQAVVTRAWQQVKLFRSRMDERGLAPQDIRSLEDIAKLPFTRRAICATPIRSDFLPAP